MVEVLKALQRHFTSGVAMKIVDRCKFCDSTDLLEYINLGDMPLVNNLLNDQKQFHKKYPLRVFFCKFCTMSQIDCVVPPEELFSHYLYKSGMSQGFKDHCGNLAHEINERHLLPAYGTCVDIASNDNTFLKTLQGRCFAKPRLYGVEPAKNLAIEAEEKTGIPVINKFFDYNTAVDIVLKYGTADVITAQNVFAHVDNIHGFMHGIHYLLKKNGTFIVEAPWSGDLIKDVCFDTVYHEHLSYISVDGMCKFVKKFDMVVDKIKYFKYMHAGTIRYYIKFAAAQDISNQWEVENAKHRECFVNENIYDGIPQRIIKITKDKLLENIGNERIIGVGAAAKSTILGNYCGFNTDIMPIIADTTPDKQGKFQPGTLIPIKPFEALKDIDNRLLIFPHNVKNEIVANVRKINPKAKFIVAIPKLEEI